jgi:glycosyltransferase involved in cell wall biosynthesis
MPIFSVVIPLYNKEAYIEDTLKSVFNQTFKDFDVIIVDDGSTDKSLEIVKKFNDERLNVYSQKNQGASIARNNGIDYSKSDYIALLDADDYWYNNHLEELKKLIDTFPEAGLFCNNYEIKRDKNLISPATFNFNFDNDCMIIKDYFTGSIINSIAWTSSVAFLKTNFKTIGGFKKSLRTGQDIDLWIRFALQYEIAFNPQITMRYYDFDLLGLSKSKYNTDRYNLIKTYKNEEKENKFLKKYLDINRYALAIRSLLNDEIDLYKKVKKEIDTQNLNLKQNILLSLPKSALRLFKTIQKKLLKNKIYLTAYR